MPEELRNWQVATDGALDDLADTQLGRRQMAEEQPDAQNRQRITADETPVARQCNDDDLLDHALDHAFVDGEFVEAGFVQSDELANPPPVDDAQSPRDSIPERYDAKVVARLLTRTVHVQPGGSATLVAQLLNNGPIPAAFSLHAEGWIDERWVEPQPVHIQLKPGEKQEIRVTVSPPRSPDAVAGVRDLALVVRSPQYPGHITRMRARLSVGSFEAVYMGKLEPRRLTLDWQRREASSLWPLTNQGNTPVDLVLSANLPERRLRLRLQPADGIRQGSAPDAITLEPGQTVHIPVLAELQRSPLLGLRPKEVQFRVSAAIMNRQVAPSYTGGEIVALPVIGPRQMTLLGGISILVVLSMTILVALISSLLNWGAVRQVTHQLEQAPPSPPVVALVVPGAPASQPPAADVPVQPPPTPTTRSVTTDGLPGVPLVQPNQVTAPGQQPSTAQAGQVPASIASPGDEAPGANSRSAGATTTYAQMFQEVAAQYDLDWRILAAQAFVESSFNPMALGSDGDLGLMQILPGTWKEWAPAVQAEDPFDSYSNVLVAAVYLDHLRTILGQAGYPDTRWMLVAYNWGPDQVLQFLVEGNQWEALPQPRQAYAQEIMRIAASIP